MSERSVLVFSIPLTIDQYLDRYWLYLTLIRLYRSRDLFTMKYQVDCLCK